MDQDEAEAVMQSAKEQFKQVGFSDKDIVISMLLLNDLFEMFNEPYIANLSPGIGTIAHWPISDKRFPEVLRVTANIFEIAQANVQKKKDSKKPE